MSEIIRAIESEQLKTNIPDFRVGDTLRVMVKVVEGERERLQAFEGVCIADHAAPPNMDKELSFHAVRREQLIRAEPMRQNHLFNIGRRKCRHDRNHDHTHCQKDTDHFFNHFHKTNPFLYSLFDPADDNASCR